MASAHVLAQFIVRPATILSALTAADYTVGSLIYLPDDTDVASLQIVVQDAAGMKSFKAITIT